MAWFDRAQRVRESVDTAADEIKAWSAPSMVTAGDLPTRSEFMSINSLWAMAVPAYSRGFQLISGTVAQLPLRIPVGPPMELLTQPEHDRGAWVTYQRTVGDLVNHGLAFWLITVLAPDGRPRYVRQLDAATVTLDDAGKIVRGPQGEEWDVSEPWTPARTNQVMVFTGYADGALKTGLDTIATALALEVTSRGYANSPHPADVLENVSNYEFTDDEIKEQIAKWKRARQAGDPAYLNAGWRLGDAKGWSPTELALTQQRNQSALQVARLLNLDPMWVGAAVDGASISYQNRVDARTELYGMTLSQVIAPIEQRVSMPDCANTLVRADASEYLRANLTERATMANALFTAGIIDRSEARDFISDRPTGSPA